MTHVSRTDSIYRIRLLGPVEIVRADRPVPAGSPRQRALLALLALSVGVAVPPSRLVDLLWGEDPPRSAGNAVQVYISRLRRLLSASGAPGELPPLRTVSGMYLLDLPVRAIDSRQFEEAGESGRARLNAGDAVGAAHELRSALQLWRGTELPDLAGIPGAAASAARLQSLRLSTLADRIDAESLLGRHSRLIPELQDLVRRHPLNERFVGQLMTSLYWDGRQADALAAYTAAAGRLGDELGIDPSPVLRELHGRLLRQDLEPATRAVPARIARSTSKSESDSALRTASGPSRWAVIRIGDRRTGPADGPTPETEFDSWPGFAPVPGRIPGQRNGGLPEFAEPTATRPAPPTGPAPVWSRPILPAARAGTFRRIEDSADVTGDVTRAAGESRSAGAGCRSGHDGSGPQAFVAERLSGTGSASGRFDGPRLDPGVLLPALGRPVDDRFTMPPVDSGDRLGFPASTGSGRDSGGAPTARRCVPVPRPTRPVGDEGAPILLGTAHPPMPGHLSDVGPGASNGSERPAFGSVLGIGTIGRTGELETALGLLCSQNVRLVTLVGPSGAGKSRLATYLAGRYLAGDRPESGPTPRALVVPLGEASGVQGIREDLPGRLLRLIGAVPDTPAEAPLDTVRRSLATHPALLVLDDLDDAPDTGGQRDALTRLLAGTVGLTVLATSRRPLGVAGEHVVGLGPLPLPWACSGAEDVQALHSSQAVQLFRERARAVQPAFEVTEQNAAAVSRLCRMLDGLPLALELTAARSRGHSPAQIVDDLAGADPAQQPGGLLSAVLDWTVGLLDETERLVLAQLSVFAGGAGLEAAERVCGPVPAPGQVIDVIGRLADKNLLIIDGSGRLGLLAPVRAHARRMLAADPQQQAACADRHAAYFAEIADTAVAVTDRCLEPAEHPVRDTEHDNLLAAVAHAEGCPGDVFARLTVALLEHGTATGRWGVGDANDWLARAQAHRPTARTGARLLLAAGSLALMGADPVAAEEILAQVPAGAAAGEAGAVIAARVALMRAVLARCTGRSATAITGLESTLHRLRTARGLPSGLWHAVVCTLADALDDVGRTGQAIGHWQRARHRAAAAGDPARLAYPLSRLAESAQERGEDALARILLGQARSAAAGAGPMVRNQVEQIAGIIELAAGDHRAALTSLRTALHQAHACGQFVLLPQIAGLLGAAHRAADPERAAALLAAGSAWSAERSLVIIGRQAGQVIAAARRDLPMSGSDPAGRAARRGAGLPFGTLSGLLRIDQPADLQAAEWV